MMHRSNNSCQVRASKMGAKGFYYPTKDSGVLRIKAGTDLEILNFLVDREYAEWQAVSIKNSDVDGAAVSDGYGVYWILKKNIM